MLAASLAPAGLCSETVHPCFNAKAKGSYGRLHLPVASSCNIRCGYCDRRHDCPNESRPGVTTRLMTPAEAADHAEESSRRLPFITVAGIAGPGDPFADPDTTLETFSLVRERCPSLIGCVSTNGLGLLEYVDKLVATGVGFVTVTVNAVNPAIGALMYDHVRWRGVLLTGEDGAAVLLARQLAAIAALKRRNVTVKVNTVVAPGLNDRHVEEIAKTVAAHGADRMNLIGLIPVKGARLGALRAPGPLFLARLRLIAGRHLKQMAHCARCRADAIGLLGGCRAAQPASI